MSDEREAYQRVAELESVPDGGQLGVEVGGRHLVLVRQGSSVWALDDACPHAGAPLSEGFVEQGILTCAWHGWSFDVRTGASVDGMGARVACHPVQVDGGHVLVRVTEPEASPPGEETLP